MNDFMLSLLDKSDALVSENKLHCFKKYSMSAGYTDMFSITGGKTSLDKMERIPDEFGLKSRTAPYLFNTVLKDGSIFSIDEAGNKSSVSYDDSSFGIRPTLLFRNDTFDNYVKSEKINNCGVYETEFGEYPQYAAAHMVGLALEDEYSNNLNNGEYCGNILMRTGKEYSFIQNGKVNSYSEFYYGSNKYIRVIVSCDKNGVILSNGNTYHNGDAVWVKVSPVKWIVDFKSKRLLSKFVLLSGLKPNMDMFDFFHKHMTNDMFFNSLTRDEMFKMICLCFYRFDYDTQIDLLKGISENVFNLDDLSNEQIIELLNRISMREYGYSRKLKQYYF